MRRLLMTALATAAIGLATPAIADPNGSTFADYNGPDLTTAIHASADDPSVAPNEGPTVYGSTVIGSGHDVAFSGYSSYDPTTGTGTATDLSITGGSGFAQVNDLDFDSKVASTQDLFAVIMNPDPAFSAYEFSIQLADAGDISIYVMLTGSSAWQLVTGSPIHQNANQNNQYLLSGLSSGSFDQILIASTGAIFQVKQNSIELATGAVPEPATWGMMLLGFAGIGMAMRRGRKQSGRLLQIA
jgi:hypothetical protein